jgi:hypothetical protein
MQNYLSSDNRTQTLLSEVLCYVYTVKRHWVLNMPYLSLPSAAGVQMNQIVGLGISTQRATFITWNK